MSLKRAGVLLAALVLAGGCAHAPPPSRAAETPLRAMGLTSRTHRTAMFALLLPDLLHNRRPDPLE